MSEQEKSTAKAGLSSTQKILIIGIVLVLAAIAAVGWIVLQKANKPAVDAGAMQATPGAGNVVMDNRNAVDAAAELQRKAADGMFEVKMNTHWAFPNGTSASTDAYVANSTANHKPFYFSIALESGGDALYTSPVLQVGQAINGLKLDSPLAAGDYPCVCTYFLMNPDNTIASQVSVTVQLHVQK